MHINHASTQIQLNNIRDLYKNSFPSSERKPFRMMLQKRKNKSMEIMCIETDDDVFLGLAITVLYDDMVLLDYFAISDKYRGEGIGSQALRMLQERYKDKRFFLEIEDVKSESKDIYTRKRRKNFYLKNNMTETGIDIILFGVNMELLVYNCDITFDEYHSLYDNVFGKLISSHVKQTGI